MSGPELEGTPAVDDPRLAERVRSAEGARRRLSTEVADLMHRLQAEEERVCVLEQQLELATAEKARAVAVATAERRRLVDLERQMHDARNALAALSDAEADRAAGTPVEAPAGPAPTPTAATEVPGEMAALQDVVDALRHSREDAERRATRLENELAALRLNERILEDELRAARAHPVAGLTASPAGAEGVARTAERDQLRSENAQLRADHARLQDEHARLRDEHLETVSRLEMETCMLRDVEAARAAADAFAADTSRDLGEAMSDLIEVRERSAVLEAELTRLRADHDELCRAHEALREQASAAEENAERNLVEQRRAHDALRADAAASHERQLHEVGAAHERAMVATEERVEAAEARVREMSAQLHAMTQSRDQVQADLEKSASAVDVMRQRLRDEIDAHNDAEERRSLLEDELNYLRAEVFSPGQTKGQKRGLLGRRDRGSPGALRPATLTATPSASKDATDAADAPVLEFGDDDRDSVLERRLFGS